MSLLEVNSCYRKGRRFISLRCCPVSTYVKCFETMFGALWIYLQRRQIWNVNISLKAQFFFLVGSFMFPLIQSRKKGSRIKQNITSPPATQNIFPSHKSEDKAVSIRPWSLPLRRGGWLWGSRRKERKTTLRKDTCARQEGNSGYLANKSRKKGEVGWGGRSVLDDRDGVRQK